MTDIEKQVMSKMHSENVDFVGAQDLVDAHLDAVAGGGFSLHVQFGEQNILAD